MKKLMLLVSVLMLSAFSTHAQTRQKYIGMTKARKIASRQVAGRIKSAELEKEHGTMIYSFDIRGKDGKIHEVAVNAYSGKIIGNQIETAADEAKEKAQDKKAKKH